MSEGLDLDGTTTRWPTMTDVGLARKAGAARRKREDGCYWTSEDSMAVELLDARAALRDRDARIGRLEAERDAMREAYEQSERTQIEMCRDFIMLSEMGLPDRSCEHCDTPLTADEVASCIADVQLCPQQAWGNDTRFPNEPCYRHKFWRRGFNGKLDLKEHFAAALVQPTAETEG